MDTSSYWIDTGPLPTFPTLTSDLRVDVVVIGAGITGITAAYLLKKSGHSVALLDRSRSAAADTGYTTAHLTCVTDTRLQELVKSFGEDCARLTWEAGSAAIDQIYTNIRNESIQCDFKWVSGYLHAPLRRKDKKDRESLKRDAALANELGFSAEFLDEIPAFGLPGVRLDGQAKFHPRKYLAALLRTIPGDGSYVFEQTEVSEVQEEPLSVKVGDHKIDCRYVVLATHTPLMGKTGIVSATLFQTKLYLYTSYALGAKIPQNLISEALYWDIDDPYYYTRIEKFNGYDYAIFGGEDHKTGQGDAEKAYAELKKVLLKMIPRAEIDHCWSGQVIETPDGLPYIGETAEKQFAATGYGGNGMTLGTLGGMMAVDAFLKRKNPWTELFSPNRKKIKGGAWDYIKENKDYPYYLVRDRLAGAESDSLDDLRPNEGKILKLKGEKVAAYRKPDGKVSLCSPVCTHLKCIVRWNDAEKTWDCPCHGSRFAPEGKVIAGPAEEDLQKLVFDSKSQKPVPVES